MAAESADARRGHDRRALSRRAGRGRPDRCGSLHDPRRDRHGRQADAQPPHVRLDASGICNEAVARRFIQASPLLNRDQRQLDVHVVQVVGGDGGEHVPDHHADEAGPQNHGQEPAEEKHAGVQVHLAIEVPEPSDAERRPVPGGRERFAPTWHWPAFGVGWLWYLYRKMYLHAGVFHFGGLLPMILGAGLVGVVIWNVFSAVTANYLYYMHIKLSLALIERRVGLDEAARLRLITDAGGVQPYVWWLGIGLTAVAIAAGIMEAPTPVRPPSSGTPA